MRGLYSLLPELAELALETDQQAEFRNAWASHVQPHIGFDTAAILSTRDGKTYATTTFNGGETSLEKDVAGYVAEFAPPELSRAMSSRTILDDDVFSAARRDTLRVYREFCRPLNLGTSAMRAWMRDGTVFFVFATRARTGRSFAEADLRAFDTVFPSIILGEALHAQQPLATSRRPLGNLGCLTPSETTVVALAQRGLTNIEIGNITGNKPVTVRNHLTAAYRKLGVSNRTELSFLLSNLDWERGATTPRASAIEKLLDPRAPAASTHE